MDREKFQLGTVAAMSLRGLSSFPIVICNKALMSALGFIFGTRSNLALPPYALHSSFGLARVCLLPWTLLLHAMPEPSARRYVCSRFDVSVFKSGAVEILGYDQVYGWGDLCCENFV
jgi:solute carrier family 35 protein E3